MKTEQQVIRQQVSESKHDASSRRVASVKHNDSINFTKAFLFLIFSLTVTISWPHLASGRFGGILWWNGWVFFTCLGMICLSWSRFLGAQHAFPVPEVLFGVIMARGLNWFLTYVRPSHKIEAVDELLYAFDVKTFGQDADVVMGKLVTWYHAPGIFIILVHKALPLALVLAYLALPNSKQIRRRYCALIGLAAVIIFGVMYGLCPGAGPAYAFGTNFPFTVPTLVTPHARILENSQLNTTPSGHLAWALLMFWFAREHCVGKLTHWLLGAFVVGTAVATMGTGEHYVIDLILAVPFAVGIWELHNRRWKMAASFLLLVGVWEVALSTAWALLVPTGIVWVMVSGTLVVPLVLVTCPRLSANQKYPRQEKSWVDAGSGSLPSE
jgi:hypothetical protein